MELNLTDILYYLGLSAIIAGSFMISTSIGIISVGVCIVITSFILEFVAR